MLDEQSASGLTCATCHQSTDPAVTGAIAAGDTSCAACHGPVDHAELHPSPLSTDCESCHQPNLVDEHVGGHNLSCAACHQSADPLVVAAIANHDTSCTACHPGAGDHTALHDVDIQNCAECHQPNLVNEHAAHTFDCAACHESTDPAVQAAIAAGIKDCGACHDFSQHPYVASAHQATVANATLTGTLRDVNGSPVQYTQNCGQCHMMDLLAEHTKSSSSVAGSSCSACHLYPRNTFADWNGTCQQGDCHANYHLSMSIRHFETYGMNPYASGGCGQGDFDCHAGYWPLNDLAAIHNQAWVEGGIFADISAYTHLGLHQRLSPVPQN
jgi:hypothetical protein